MSLNFDLIYEILKWLDGTTLSSTDCASSLFHFATREENIWEELCSSLWPSTRNEEVSYLISTLGGFEKSYKNFFPMVLNVKRAYVIHYISEFGKSKEL